ncbi:MAG: DUF4270 domain-containing protein [Bacteroidales bacterium]|nr:DUF4270 domain-containing protein [Bacteroidales bacterium]
MASIIGGGLQPGDEYIFAVFDDTTASLRLVAYTIADDSAVTSGRAVYSLGSYNSETFGTLTVNLITQMWDPNLLTHDSVTKEPEHIDSVFILFAYGRSYPSEDGFPTDPIRINIGELIDPVLNNDSTFNNKYYSKQYRDQRSGSLLRDYTINPSDFRDSVVDPSDTSGQTKLPLPILKIPLNHFEGKEYAKKLLEASRKAALPSASDEPLNTFLREIPGLYFEAHPETSPGRGNVVSFNFATEYHGTPGIRVFYRNEGDTVSRYRDYSFYLFWNGGMTYNYINIDNTKGSGELNSLLRAQLGDGTIVGDTTSGQEMVFLQSFYGSLVRVQMPDIRKFAETVSSRHDNKSIVINQACLVINVKPEERFKPATQLNIGHRVAADTIFGIRDHSSFIGGQFNEKKSEYRIFLTRHIQNLLLDTLAPNVPLTLFSSTQHTLPDITTIYGPSKAHGDRRMRLEIVYSVLP